MKRLVLFRLLFFAWASYGAFLFTSSGIRMPLLLTPSLPITIKSERVDVENDLGRSFRGLMAQIVYPSRRS
jgi:hypothetical protein